MINIDYYNRWKELDDKVNELHSNEDITVYISTNSSCNVYISNSINNIRSFCIEFDDAFLLDYCPKTVNGIITETKKINKLNKNKRYLVVKNANKDFDDAFLAFSVTCFNEIENTMSEHDALSAFERIIEDNHNFFSFKHKMSKEEEQGLLAELLYLEELITKNDESFVRFWFGCEKNKRDFIVNDTGIEIKSTKNQEQDIVHISNENQLDLGMLYKLYLKLYVFDENESGISLDKEIKKIYDTIKSAEYQKLFLSKVSMHKIDPLNYESKYCFSLEKVKTFDVNESFPKLTRSNIPSMAFDVKYKLNISGIEYEEQ